MKICFRSNLWRRYSFFLFLKVGRILSSGGDVVESGRFECLEVGELVDELVDGLVEGREVTSKRFD